MQHFDAGIGDRAGLDTELKTAHGDGATAARVVAQHTDRWLVVSADPPRRPWLAHARGRLRDTAAGPPVTGDWVALDAAGVIVGVLERRGTISRRAAGPAGAQQLLAANVDLALIVESLPDPNSRRAERFVAIATAGGVEAALVLTKADLDPDAWQRATPVARGIGLVDSVAVSAPTGEGLGVLRSMVTPGQTAVLLGPSGVGKSTLANALLGADLLATGPVRAGDGRGRHTTVAREMVALPGGALLIDTPGIREVGLWEGTGSAFADIETAAADCRFSDCAHDAEPGCEVRATVDPERIAAWRKLVREQAWIEDRKVATEVRREFGRAIAKEHRAGARLDRVPPHRD
jgi:ribosome biogenesis GTPase